MNKNEICLSSLYYPISNDNDPLHQLLIEYKDIEEIKKICQKNNNNQNDFIHFLYLNKNKIHSILYDEQKIIPIDLEKEINFSELFYLSLLISDDEDIINYTFSIEYIRYVNDKFGRNEEIKGLKKIIISKIILILIHNFKGELQYYRNKDVFEEEIKELEKENIERINNCINNNNYIFSELNLNYTVNDICLKKIDCIYLEIIIALIKKFNKNYNNDNTIEEKLELVKDDINIIQIIFQGLSEEINKKNNYIKQYEINNTNDLEDLNKLNFYLFLVKYIFKNSFYIYQNDFLYKNIKKLLYFVKDEKKRN